MRKPGCMWFCMQCNPKIEKNILNWKLIEQRCERYFSTLNARIEEIEKLYSARGNEKARMHVFCMPGKPKIEKNILNEKLIE